MKKFHFTLDRMLDFKNQILDKEKDALGRIRQKKNQVDAEMERYRKKLQDCAREMLEEQNKGTTVNRLMLYSIQAENTRSHLEQLAKEQRALEKEIERQAQVVLKASQEVSSLEKLEEKQLEQYQYEEKRETNAEILEFVTGSLARRPKPKGS